MPPPKCSVDLIRLRKIFTRYSPGLDKTIWNWTTNAVIFASSFNSSGHLSYVEL